MTNIAVIGTGNVGRTIGAKWAQAGHAVVFGHRRINESVEQALREADGKATTRPIAAAIAENEVVLLAIPGMAVDGFLAEHGASLNGKIVIDATNRVGGDQFHDLEVIHANAPKAIVVRAFNTLGWELFANPLVNGEQASLFFCCDEGGKETAVSLIEAVGLTAVYLGDNSQIPLVDSLARVWFALAFGQKMGRRVALRLVHEA